MVDISRVRIAWTGWTGAPGVSTLFYAAPPTSAQLAGWTTFFTNIKAQTPLQVTTQVENAGQQIHTDTGKAFDTWSGPAQPLTTGTGATGLLSAAGWMIRWNTGQFFNGRQVRGRMFMIPTIPTIFDVDGTLIEATRTLLQGHVNTLLSSASGGLVVYSQTAKNAFVVTSATVMDKLLVMRSRRD